MTPADSWDEYASAAQRLDAVRRDAASVAAQRTGTLRAAREELAAVRRRIAAQQAHFGELAVRYGVRLPSLTPSDADVVAAMAPGSGPADVLAALHRSGSTLDSVDAELEAATAPGRRTGRLADRPAWIRNLAVYGAFAVVVLALQVLLFVLAPNDTLPVLAPVCGLILPLMAFALGWLAIGIVFPPARDAPVDRTPLVGAMVCIVAPVLLTCAGFGVVALMN